MTQEAALSFSDTRQTDVHAARRQLVLQKYPRVRRLLDAGGANRQLVWQTLGLLGLQLSGAFYGRLLTWPWMLVMAYGVGGIGAHALWAVIHECSHNQAFGSARPLANQLLAMVANLPLVVPQAAAFRRYHQLHHRHLGERRLDADVPTELEARLVGGSWPRKLLYVVLLPWFYYLRPLFVNPLVPGPADLLNVVLQLLFDWLVVQVLGWYALLYLLASFLLPMGLHPLAGHFLSDHVQFHRDQETYSYYGPLNALVNNTGYHSEHHDFPTMASSRLPELRRIAAGVYGQLHSHTSWCSVIYHFITDPSITLASRVRRDYSTQKLTTATLQSDKPHIE